MENLSQEEKQLYIRKVAYGNDPDDTIKELEERREKAVRSLNRYVWDGCDPNHPKHITITPISGDCKKDAFINYDEQKNRIQKVWDDGEMNTTTRGDFFAFYLTESKHRPKGKFIIHLVYDVKSPRDRLPSWSKNVGQKDKQVLELSEPLFELTIEEWKIMEGPMKKQGTYRSAKSAKNKRFMTKLNKLL